MSSNSKGKMTSVASFFKERFNIVENSIVFMVLLGLEKLMDVEFNCPEHNLLAVGYSIVFIVVPTVIVGFVACHISPHGVSCCQRERAKSSSDEEEAGETNALQTLEMSEATIKTTNTQCGCRCNLLWMKAVGFWIMIIFTDGQYLECFVTSVDHLTNVNKTNVSNQETPLNLRGVQNAYLVHVFQMIGLLFFLLLTIVVIFCNSRIHSGLSLFGIKFESETDKCKINEDMLQIVEDTIQEEATKRQKEFVKTLLSSQEWTSYDPRKPDAPMVLGKITAKWKAEVERQLNMCAPQTTSSDQV